MKKIVLLSTFFILCFAALNAQFSAGIKGGLNSGYLSGFDGNNRLSGHVGFFVNRTIAKGWHFQPEILYSGEGQRYFTDDEERVIALEYIQIPLLFQYYPARQLYFEFGPQIGILASARDKGLGNDVLNVKNEFAPSQVGLNLGLGLKATPNLAFYGRYCFGLTDVSRFDNIVDQSRVGQIGVAIHIQ